MALVSLYFCKIGGFQRVVSNRSKSCFLVTQVSILLLNLYISTCHFDVTDENNNKKDQI